jgi:hypothetical protein
MTAPGPRYSREEFARRGHEIYERTVLPAAKPEDQNKYVAIDIESGDYEMDHDDYTAPERLLSRHPDAQMWMERIGHPAATRFGWRSLGWIKGRTSDSCQSDGPRSRTEGDYS